MRRTGRLAPHVSEVGCGVAALASPLEEAGCEYTFVSAQVCAYTRANMLSGFAATQVCFALNSSDGGLLPSDVGGSTLSPTGSQDYLLNFGTNSLNLWRFHVGFTKPANFTLPGLARGCSPK